MFFDIFNPIPFFPNQNERAMGGILLEEARRRPSTLNRSLFRTYPKKKKNNKINFQIPADKNKIFKRTGFSADEFNKICLHVWKKMPNSRKTKKFEKKQFRFMVLVTLDALRRGYNTSYLSDLYRIDRSTVSRWFRKTSILLSTLLPTPKMDFENAEFKPFAVDGTHHPRTLVHPGWKDYFQVKKRNCLISQIICSKTGHLVHFVIARGHNNDQGIFKMSEVEKILEENKTKILADKGYTSKQLITPEDPNWEKIQGASSRIVIEHLNATIKKWAFAATTCKISPFIQAVGLKALFKLIAMFGNRLN
jgi:hypothetical protein